jgi:hypothetical protein
MTLSIALIVILVSSALSVGPFFVQSVWALPFVSSVSVSPSSTEKTKGETATFTVTVTRASGQASGDVNLSFQSSTIPSSAVSFSNTKATFGNGGSNSKSVTLQIKTNDLPIQEHTFTVKGTKSNAASDSATSGSTKLTVTKPPNQLPTAEAGSDFSVDEGTAGVQLQGSGSDPDGTISSYKWEQVVSGSEPTVTLTDENTATAKFDAPSVSANTELTFKLTVTDNDGATAIDSVKVTVNNANQPPTANAGSDQTVNEGDSVSLDGSGSTDPDGDTLTYAWTQTAGASVTLSGSDSATPSFTAPDVSADGETLTFELTVDDGNGHTATDTVNINIQNVVVNQPPVASLSANPSAIEEGSTSTLDASASTDDAGIVQYTFEQVGGTAGTITVDSTDLSKATFKAPSLSADETATIKLTVKDAQDATDSTTVVIAVKNAAAHATTLTLNVITSTLWGNDVTVTGKLADNAASGAGVGSATISFDGTGATNLQPVTTNADGTFTAKGKSPTSVATGWRVQAHFAGNSDYSASNSIIRTYSTTRHPILIALTAPATTPWERPTAFTVTVTDSATGGTVIEGKTISFDGTGVIGVANVITDANGKATGTGTAPNTVATGWTYQAHFAGDSLYLPKDSTIRTYSTTKHAIGLSIAVSPTSVAPGASYKVSGTLTDTTVQPQPQLASKTITFTADAPITIADKTTNANGFFTATQAAPSTAGTYNIQSHFAGDSLYNAKDSLIRSLTVQ